ncbi:MAG: hypothetical protein JW755_10905 [Candidatus Aminicenantes bacterium]|nr:hypothetical protein [Candidatus Aminicenantes bacterium]
MKITKKFGLFIFLSALIFQSQTYGNESWGNLKPGEYSTGFRLITTQDLSRVYPNTKSTELNPRPIRIYIWYPAEQSSQPPMKFNEYIQMAYDDFNSPSESNQDMNIMEILPVQILKGIPSEKIETLLKQPTYAIRDITPIPGKYPLLLFGQGLYYESPLCHFILCEFLASHGYVVATCPLLGTHYRLVNINVEDLETQVRDLEFALGYARNLPYVDSDRTGIIGYDLGGMTGLILVMRNPDIKVFLSMDSAITHGHYSGLPQSHFSYREEKFVIPWMHMMQTRFIEYYRKQQETSSLFQQKKYGASYFVAVPTNNHGCFSAFAAMGIENSLPGYWGPIETNIVELHDQICTTALLFLNGYLKNDQTPKDIMDERTKNDQDPTVFFEYEYKPGVMPPPTKAYLIDLIIKNGVKSVKPEIERLKKVYTAEELVEESVVNWLGYHFLYWWNRPNEALEVFKLNVWLFPESANAYSSLGEGYMILGNNEDAIYNLQKSLDLNPDDAAVKNLLERLKKADTKK